jgi:hypothetical protein
MKHAKNNAGFTILENLIALTMLAIIFYSMTMAFTQIFNLETRTTGVVNEQQMVAMIIETIKAEPSVFQKNFNSTLKQNPMEILTDANLPLGFEKDYFGPKEGCPIKCEGFLGYTIQPFDNYQSLFEGTIRVTFVNKTDPTTDNVGDHIYRFIVHSN